MSISSGNESLNENLEILEIDDCRFQSDTKYDHLVDIEKNLLCDNSIMNLSDRIYEHEEYIMNGSSNSNENKKK